MGCSGIFVKEEVNPEITKILLSLDTKIEEYNKTFKEEVDKAKKDQEEALKKRHEKLSKLKEEKKEITEDIIKELNKDDLKAEIDILSNQVNKMHYIFDTGLDLVEPLRKITLDSLLEKAKSAPALTLKAINEKIEKIKSEPAIDFLNSTYGKVLKDALTKKGMSATMLKGFKKDLMKERSERRKKEREEFGIEVNEFKDEDYDKLKLDFYELVEEEYKEIHKNYKEYCKDKMIEAMFEKK